PNHGGRPSAPLPRRPRDGDPTRRDDHRRARQRVAARGSLQGPLRPGDERAGLRAVRDLSERREPGSLDPARALGRPGGSGRSREAQQYAAAPAPGAPCRERRARRLRISQDALARTRPTVQGETRDLWWTEPTASRDVSSWP